MNKKPLTMDELLHGSSKAVVVPKIGQVLKGTIAKIDKKMMLVDIGAKTDGVVAEREFAMAQDLIEGMKVGDQIEAVVISEYNNQGQIGLSLRQAALDAKWDYFINAQEKDLILEAKGIETNKGGLIVLVNGVRGFVPSSQFGKDLVSNFQSLENQKFKVRVIEVDKDKNRLIFSERHVSEEKELAHKEQAMSKVEVGKTYQGLVSGVMHFGLFVTVEVPLSKTEMGHVEGLVHISEISWEKVNHPKDYHQVGESLEVKVLGRDERTGKLNLSIKQLQPNPWIGIEEKYPVGTTITGKVSRVEGFGVFVNVEPGVDGLIHNSKLDGQVNYKKDDTVTVHVDNISSSQKRMSLSLINTARSMEYR